MNAPHIIPIEPDPAAYARLAERAMDVNEICVPIRRDLERTGLLLARAMLEIQEYHEAGRITTGQRDRLKAILNADLEEPTVDNDLPIFKLRFPSPDYDPPPRAA